MFRHQKVNLSGDLLTEEDTMNHIQLIYLVI